MSSDSVIRLATDRDIDDVHAWLKQEKQLGVHGNFLCNWNVILHHHRDQRVHVYVERDTPVAFVAGGLTRDGILQVRDAQRGRGVGKALVQHALRACVAAGRSIVVIECAPTTSIPFWRKMGFVAADENQDVDGSHYAYLILEMRHELPAEGKPVDVVIRFFPDQRLRNTSVKPLSTHSPRAVEAADGEVHLSERIAFANLTYARDVVVEIVVDQRPLYLEKAKREAGAKLGIVRCDDGFIVDKLHI